MIVAIDIRTAKYLQAEGRGGEAWEMLAGLLDNSESIWFDINVLDAMRLHLQREGAASRAIHYGIAHRLARVQLYREMAAAATRVLESEESPPNDAFERELWVDHRTLQSHHLRSARQWLSELETTDAVAALIGKLHRKAGSADPTPTLLKAMHAIETGTTARDYLREHDSPYDTQV
jgi:hypothetical protein